MLDSNRVTAQELIRGNYDFVICSYGYIQAQYRSLLAYQEFFAKVAIEGQREAEEATNRRLQQRRRLSLFSELYSILNLPINHLILDEAQYVKNWETLTHKAIKALNYLKVLAVTGTPIANKWWDIYGIIHFMKGHPFPEFSDFIRIFGDMKQRRANPPSSKLPRLVKFLMEVTVSRPASLLELPGLKKIVKSFELSDSDCESVMLYTKLFIDALRKSNHDTNNASFRTAASVRKALVFATRAQQYAAHSHLIEPGMPSQLEMELQEMATLRAEVKKECAKETGVSFANALLAYLQSVPANTSVPNNASVPIDDPESADETDPDYDPNKGLVTDDDEIEPLVQGQDAEEVDKNKRKRWMNKVAKMTDASLASPRITAVSDICRYLKSKDATTRIAIFSKYVKFLDLVNEFLKRHQSIVSLRLDGGSNKAQREETTNAFASTAGSILLITPKTGGAGLNGLECASKLIQCEPWWTGTEEAQAYSRLYRSKQAKVVEVYYLVAEDSCIDMLVERVRDGKNETNERIMGPLRRKDDDPPQIPRVPEWY